METIFNKLLNITKLNEINNIQFGGVDHDVCKADIIRETMREFKKKQLKSKANKIVTDKNQAIAIALSIVERKCKYNASDAKKLIEKVTRDLNDINKKLILTNIVETKDAISYLYKHNKLIKANLFKKLLWDKILKSQLNNEELSQHMWTEIKNIHKITK